MELEKSVEIEKSLTDVWNAVVDFENCQTYISSIKSIEVLNKPIDTLVGFKWKETRIMFGKEATETMWVTDYIENSFYQTRAESHGSVYISKLAVEPVGNNTKLTMSFRSEPQSFFVKVLSACIGFLAKGAMTKALTKDLTDIKTYLESK
ncbi:MAG: carbon monoxide dehydrogenase subunit G [Bacteroidia bacterium]|jgi:carbon monoxide dehydrogenase subunit G